MGKLRTAAMIGRQLLRPEIARGTIRDVRELRADVRVPQPDGVGTVPAEEALDAIGPQAAATLDEPELAAIEAEVARRRSEVGETVHELVFDSSGTLGRLAWAAIRTRRPQVVVETGVAAGRSSALMLAALAANGEGHLVSIDPAIDRDGSRSDLGYLVPDELRDRWTLVVGRSRERLPRVIREHGRLGMFVHDGLHTLKTMRWEADVAGAALTDDGVLLMDDAERNPAFAGWAQVARPRWWSLVQTEHAHHFCGLALR